MQLNICYCYTEFLSLRICCISLKYCTTLRCIRSMKKFRAPLFFEGLHLNVVQHGPGADKLPSPVSALSSANKVNQGSELKLYGK